MEEPLPVSGRWTPFSRLACDALSPQCFPSSTRISLQRMVLRRTLLSRRWPQPNKHPIIASKISSTRDYRSSLRSAAGVPRSPTPNHPLHPGKSTNGSLLKSTHRSQQIRTDCKLRDPNCQICNSNNSGSVAHIIPSSVKAIDFWKFVELFRGAEATAALKAAAVAPNPEVVDNLKNVWFLCKICHDNFDRAKLAIIPDLDDLTYPNVTTSVSYSPT